MALSPLPARMHRFLLRLQNQIIKQKTINRRIKGVTDGFELCASNIHQYNVKK